MRIHKIKTKGFTLIELLVVVTIVGIVSIGSIAVYTNTQQKARDTSRISDMQNIKSAIQLQYMNEGVHLPPDQIVDYLISKNYLTGIPVDPLAEASKEQGFSLFPTAFAKPEKVEVCHNGHTIEVNENAVDAHLNHGDTLGECGDDEDSGDDEDEDEETVLVCHVPGGPETMEVPESAVLTHLNHGDTIGECEEEEEENEDDGGFLDFGEDDQPTAFEYNYVYGVADDEYGNEGQYFEVSMIFENSENQKKYLEGGNDDTRYESGEGVALVNTQFNETGDSVAGSNTYKGSVVEAEVLLNP